jgi:hypothetical protein
MEDRTVEVGWPPGHKGIPGNERADELAKRGAKMWAPDVPTLTHTKRSTKERAMKARSADWGATRRVGQFGAANNFPPSLRPHDHFTATQREVYRRLIQCRMGHAFTGEYYDRFVPTESTECRCGEHIQMHEHIIRSCPRYAEHRHILQTNHPNLNIADLMGTKIGLEALVKFLKASGAFTKTGEPRSKPPRPALGDEEDPHREAETTAERSEEGETGSLEGSNEDMSEGEG